MAIAASHFKVKRSKTILVSMSAEFARTLPPELEEILTQHRDLDELFSKLMPALGQILDCDRTFLYLRHPQTRWGRVPYCWCKDSSIPQVYDPDWKPEPESLVEEDPMFAAAVRTEPSIFVEDVETASPKVLNRDFEQENFGHRALIHGHLCQEGQLWGILQPCTFDRPRIWVKSDRALILETIQRLTPLAAIWVQHSAPG
ncbi:MAG: GAF domain-containing protein [Desertifilum sp.]|nr:GAF domain-containing protein [Desertifilum sp.]